MKFDCPCGSNNSYATCCGVYIDLGKAPQTPEQLMRSRYTAFNLGKIQYINETMTGESAERQLQEVNNIHWLRLEICKCSVNKTSGFVEFKAFFQCQGRINVMHENSFFQLINERWMYVSGTKINSPPPVRGRNDQCICGSGLKYKKCCLLK